MHGISSWVDIRISLKHMRKVKQAHLRQTCGARSDTAVFISLVFSAFFTTVENFIWSSPRVVFHKTVPMSVSIDRESEESEGRESDYEGQTCKVDE